MFVANLQTLARLNGGIVEVKVIELNLHGFDLRIAAENFIQYFRRIVKGDPDVLYPPFRLEFERLLVGAVSIISIRHTDISAERAKPLCAIAL